MSTSNIQGVISDINIKRELILQFVHSLYRGCIDLTAIAILKILPTLAIKKALYHIQKNKQKKSREVGYLLITLSISGLNTFA